MKHLRKPSTADLGLLLIRVSLGVVFFFHGGQKLFGLFGGYGLEATAQWMGSIGIPWPTLSASLAGGAEFFGGIALLLGFATRPAAGLLVITMLTAASTLTGFDVQAGGMEYPLTLAAVSGALVLLGPGRLSLTGRAWTSEATSPGAHSSGT